MNLSLCSDVWEHLKRMENTAVCCHCKKELSYCKTTTNLIDHLLPMHLSKYLQNAEKKIEVKTNIDSFVNKTQRSCEGNHTTDCRNNGTGFKAGGNGGFRIDALSITFNQTIEFLPPCILLMQCLQEKYLQAKSTLIEMLKEPSHIALMTHIWTSVATQAYITVTAHFVVSK